MATVSVKKKAVKKAATKRAASKKTSTAKKDVSSSYDRHKFFQGRQYTGMEVGRSHKWNYDSGVWRETKITPERWELTYNVVKRRAGHAPEGSGVPVGTGYHWFILSHQFVEKLNADDYTTSMVGMKFKLAHKSASKNKWSASDKAQRNNLIKILEGLIDELKKEPEKTVPVLLDFTYRDTKYEGVGIPVISSCLDGVCQQLDITLNKEHLGVLRCTRNGWKITGIKQGLVNAIGDEVFHWYE
jgi:hypothetical protein